MNRRSLPMSTVPLSRAMTGGGRSGVGLCGWFVIQQACDGNDAESILRQVRNVVPAYRPADEVNAEGAAALAGR